MHTAAFSVVYALACVAGAIPCGIDVCTDYTAHVSVGYAECTGITW